MKTLEERLTIVRKIAQRLRKAHHLTPPVDLEALAVQEKIRIEPFSSQAGIDGYVNLDCNDPVIYINTEQTYLPRKRFTLAHEIGHIHIPWHTDVDGCVTDNPYVYIQKQRKIDSQEYEANTFASELLIPSEWLQEKVSQMQDFRTLLNEIVRQTRASVMACLYALENAFPSGHVIFITTDAMEYWKSFRSVNTLSWKAGCLDPFLLLDNICIDRQIFSRGTYQVRYYSLLPCPDLHYICDIYEACSKNFGELLNTLTDHHPERVLHCLDLILSILPDPIYIFLESYDSNQIIRYHTPDCQIRVPYDISDYDQLTDWVVDGGITYEEVLLAGGKRLSWIKERQHTEPPFAVVDSKWLLKNLLCDYYCQPELKSVLQHINGVIGNMNRANIASREALFTHLKTRFSQDELVRPIIEDPRFNQFLSNRISEIIARRNT